MKTIYHPTLPGVTEDVPDALVEAWVAQGWRKTAPKTEGSDTPSTTTGKA